MMFENVPEKNTVALKKSVIKNKRLFCISIIYSCMLYKRLLCFLLASVMLSCQEQKTDDTIPVSVNSDTIATRQSTPGNPVPDNDSMFYRKLEKGIPVNVNGRIKGVGMPVKLFLDIADGDSLHIVLVAAEPDAVIRINQIIFPDKTADGPFGRKLDYKIQQLGAYTLVLGNNLMAEGNPKTAFTLTVTLY